MMQPEDNALAELEEMAGAYLSDEELDIVMRLERGSIREAVAAQSEMGLAVLRGRIKAKAMHRIGVMKLAVAGSAPAQALAERFMSQCEIANM
jgi:hypothetical protein